MPNGTCKTLLDQLLSNIPDEKLTMQSKEAASGINVRVLVAVANSCAFTLLKFALTRTNEIDVNFDVLANELLS